MVRLRNGIVIPSETAESVRCATLSEGDVCNEAELTCIGNHMVYSVLFHWLIPNFTDSLTDDIYYTFRGNYSIFD